MSKNELASLLLKKAEEIEEERINHRLEVEDRRKKRKKEAEAERQEFARQRRIEEQREARIRQEARVRAEDELIAFFDLLTDANPFLDLSRYQKYHNDTEYFYDRLKRNPLGIAKTIATIRLQLKREYDQAKTNALLRKEEARMDFEDAKLVVEISQMKNAVRTKQKFREWVHTFIEENKNVLTRDPAELSSEDRECLRMLEFLMEEAGLSGLEGVEEKLMDRYPVMRAEIFMKKLKGTRLGWLSSYL